MNPERILSHGEKLIESLFEKGAISKEKKGELEKELPWSCGPKSPSLPIQAVLIIGAWISAFLFLACLATLGVLDPSKAASCIILGFVLVMGAITWVRSRDETEPFKTLDLFAEQFSVVCILAGKLCIFLGFLNLMGWKSVSDPLVPFTALIIAGITYPFFNVNLERFLSSFAAFNLCAFWCHHEFPPGIPILAALLLALGWKISVDQTLERAGRPLLMASVLVLSLLCLVSQVESHSMKQEFDMASTLLCLVLLLAFQWNWWMVYSQSKKGQRALIFICFSFIALFFLWVPGGILLPYSLVVYYFMMRVDLATKSYYLMGAGVILLALRIGVELWRGRA